MFFQAVVLVGVCLLFASGNVEACGFSVMINGGQRQQFGSPGFPKNYSAFAECTWDLRAQSEYILQFDAESFNLQGSGSSFTCQGDYVEINDVSHGQTVRSASFCGDDGPYGWQTTGDRATVYFRSDGAQEFKGFLITASVKSPSQASCGGEFALSSSESLSIVSPRYPNSYPANADCTWDLIAPLGTIIQLDSAEFELEVVLYFFGCQYDYVEISGVFNESNSRFCGLTGPSGIQTIGNVAKISFKTDHTNHGSGFNITAVVVIRNASFTTATASPQSWTTISDIVTTNSAVQCGGIITLSSSESYSLISPNFPQKYPPNSNCTWYITAPVGKRIHFDSVHFSLEFVFWGDDCPYDHVTIKEELTNQTSVTHGRFCGQAGPQRVQTQQNTANVYFQSDFQGEFVGFNIKLSVIEPEDISTTALSSTNNPVTATTEQEIGVGSTSALCLSSDEIAETIRIGCRRGNVTRETVDLNLTDATIVEFDGDHTVKCRNHFHNLHSWLLKEAGITARIVAEDSVQVQCKKGVVDVSQHDAIGSEATKLVFRTSASVKCHGIFIRFLQYAKKSIK